MTTLREHDDQQRQVLASTPDDEQAIGGAEIEIKTETVEDKIVFCCDQAKVLQPPIVDFSELATVRSRLRDHSAEKLLPPHTSSIQRSISCRRPQEITETTFLSRSIFPTKREEKPREEHIYDNLDLFRRHPLKPTSDSTSTENPSTTNNPLQTREPSIHTATRLRPVTMLIPSINEKETTNEFEHVLNQFKNRAAIKQVQPEEAPTQPSVPVEQPPTPVLTKKEPILLTKKVVEPPSVVQVPNRRKTVGGVHLPGNNKVAVEETKPTPSWIDIAKQKQSKL